MVDLVRFMNHILISGEFVGGGVALLHASKELEKLHTSWYNEKKKRNNRMLGVHLVQKALKVFVIFFAYYFSIVCFSNLTGQYYSGISFLTNLRLRVQAPVCSIAHAAGFDYSVVVEKLLEQDNPGLGYDPAKGLF